MLLDNSQNELVTAQEVTTQEVTQKPVTEEDSNQVVTPINVNDMQIIPEGSMITVEELLARDKAEKELDLIKQRDNELLEEIRLTTDAIIKEEIIETTEVKGEEKVTEDVTTNVDDVSAYEKSLQTLKSKVDQKIYEYEARMQTEKKIHEIEKSGYEEKIISLNKKISELENGRVNPSDESVSKYDFLRNQLKTNPEDTRVMENLKKFHTRYASVYYGVDENDLEDAINIVKERNEKQKSQAFNGYGSTGGYNNGGVQQDNNNQNSGKLNPDLLKGSSR